MKLSGKVALVTGSGRGIGASIAKALAQEGAKVVVNDIREDRAKQTVQEIESLGGIGMFNLADVSKENSVSSMVAEVNKAFGKVDILVNNAMTPTVKRIPFLETKWEDVVKDMDILLKGTYLCCEAVVPAMITRKWGRIINLCASALSHPFIKMYGYWIAKGGVAAFSRTLALELGIYGITVNCVSPGLTKTDIHREFPPEQLVELENEEQQVINVKQAIKRWGLPDDIAKAVLYFASDDSSFITGANLHVSGGMTTAPF